MNGANQPFRCDPPVCRLTPEMMRYPSIALQQPQYATFDPPEQSHPDIEDSGRDLIGVVE
jgi:hypothetical protein